MTEVSVDFPIGRLPFYSTTSGPPTLSTTVALDTFASASDCDAFAVAFIPKVGVPITHVGYLQDSITGTPGAGSCIGGLQGLNASGQADDTFLGGGSPASGTFQPVVGNNGKFTWVALDNPYTPLTAAPIVMVFRQTAADASNFLTVKTVASSMTQSRTGAPYALTRAGTTWTKSAEVPVWGVKNGATPTVVQGFPVEAFGTHNFSNAAQAGLQFKLPSGLGTAYKIAKLCFQGDPGASGTTIAARISTSAGTEQAAYANTGIDSDFAAAAASAARHFEYPFTAPSDITPGTLYTAHLAPSGGAQGTDILYLDVTDANDLLAFASGPDFVLMTRASGSGAFTAANSGKRRPLMWLELQSITVADANVFLLDEAPEYLRPYGAGATGDIVRSIRKAASSDLATSADWTPATGDVKISKDGGNYANIATLPVAVGGAGSVGWKFVFSDAELEAAIISVQVVDSATKAVADHWFSILTYGANAGAGMSVATEATIATEIQAAFALNPPPVDAVKINGVDLVGDGDGTPIGAA